MSSANLAILQSQLTGAKPSAEVKLALTQLSAEIAHRTSRGSSASYEFLIGAVHAVSRMRGITHSDLRLNCMFDSGLFFYRLGFAQAALETSASIEGLARRTNNRSWMRKASTLSGIVHMETGNIVQALMNYCEGLRLARELGDKWGEAAVLINIATAFNYGSLYRESIKCLSRAIELCDDEAARKLAANAYCDLAQAYLALEEHERGFAAITRSLDVSEEPEDSGGYFSRTIREYTYVQLALEMGKLARAREHAAACTHYSQWGGNARCKTLALIASGLCEIRGGDVQKGLAQLENALANSGAFIASRIDVLNALVKAYDDAGRPEEALSYLAELLAVVRKLRGQSIEAVLSVGDRVSGSPLTTGHASDVRGLELREAQLRAKVAEHQLMNSQLEMFERFAITADLKEESSGEHGYRVARLTALLAIRIGFTLEDAGKLEVAARLHDIGKIGVPDRILLSSAALKHAEVSSMRAHAVIGAELLGKSRFSRLQLAELIARHHHEWWDGTGYPSKLSGKRIPLHARIVALADVFDALTHGRPYSPAWPVDRALEEIRQRRGTQFDPDLTDAFLALIDDLRREHADLDAYLGEAGRNSPFLQARERIRLMLEGERQAENIASAAAERVH